MDSTKESYECAICLQLMAEPVVLPKCKHAFCLHCIQNLDEFSADTFKCPMCRHVYKSNIHIQIDPALQKKIEQANPDIYNQRLHSIIKEKEEMLSQAKIKIIYGNHHKTIVNLNSQNNHEWTVFVDVEMKGQTLFLLKGVGDLIEQVVFTLHDTFRPPVVTISQPPFALKRLGWGTFTIPIKIVFKKEFNLPDLQLDHYLSFEENGETRGCIVKLQQHQQQQQKQVQKK